MWSEKILKKNEKTLKQGGNQAKMMAGLKHGPGKRKKK
jgi:hypothetical protein